MLLAATPGTRHSVPMGQLRLPTPSDLAAFPGCKQIAHGTIPLAQCVQALEHGYIADANHVANLIRPYPDRGWVPNEHVGKTCYFEIPPLPWTSAVITGNTSTVLFFFMLPASGSLVHWYIDNGPGYEQQQDAQSFMDDALLAGYAATRKGGLVVTDSPPTPRNEQCFLLSDPL